MTKAIQAYTLLDDQECDERILKAKEELIEIRNIYTEFGYKKAKVNVNVYNDTETLVKLEQREARLLKKKEEASAKEEPAEEAAPAAAPAEKPAEEAPKEEPVKDEPKTEVKEEPKEEKKEEPKAEKPEESK